MPIRKSVTETKKVLANISVGRFILEYRKEHGLTQRAFADKVGLTHGVIARTENWDDFTREGIDLRHILITDVEQIADALDVPMIDILTFGRDSNEQVRRNVTWIRGALEDICDKAQPIPHRVLNIMNSVSTVHTADTVIQQSLFAPNWSHEQEEAATKSLLYQLVRAINDGYQPHNDIELVLGKLLRDRLGLQPGQELPWKVEVGEK